MLLSPILPNRFLFYEIGGWNPSGNGQDYIYVNVGNSQIDLGSFHGKKNDDANGGVVDGIQWAVNPVTKSADLGFGMGNKKDQIHKVTLKIPAEDLGGTLSFGFDVKILTSDSDSESAGIDDLRIVAFKESCSIECDGTIVVTEDFDEKDESDWGAVTVLPGGHAILGPLKAGAEPIAKNFQVSEFADSARVEFKLYEIDNWAGSPDSKLVITIGTETFDLALSLYEDKEDLPGTYVEGDQGEDGGIHWELTTVARGADLGLGGENADKIHLVTIDVDSAYFETGSLYISYAVEAAGDVAAGIDDFKISVFPDPEKCGAAKKEEEEEKDYCPEDDEEPFEDKKCYQEEKTKVCTPTSAPGPTPEPTKPPNRSLPTPPTPNPPTYITGDPHIRKWDGVTYDFQ